MRGVSPGPPLTNMHFWDRMAQGVSFLAMKQLTWILLCWAIISPRFEKRKKKKLVLGRTCLINREGENKRKQKTSATCSSPCCLGTSGLPVTFSQILNAKLFKIIEENTKQNWHELGFGHVDHKLCSLNTTQEKQSRKKKQGIPWTL